jgi:phosphatidylglycerophosphate synthase
MPARIAVKALIVFVAIMRIAMRHRRQHPFERFGPANIVTSIRAALVAILVGLIGERGSPAVATSAAALALVITILDGVDGALARRTAMSSTFGARFDLEVDALLIQVLAILAWQYGKAGVWVLASGLLRYAFVAAGWVLPWMAGPLPPTFRAKLICVVQIIALIVILLPWVTPPLSVAIAGGALAALTASFAIDTLRLWRTR